MRVMTMSSLAAACTLALLLAGAPAQAALRCGARLVVEGDRKIDVLSKCGEPTLVSDPLVYQRTRPRRGVHGRVSGVVVVPASTEEWTYNFGPRRFVHVIRFSRGRVVEITSLDHGY